jgi:hypothetical protein
MLSTMGNSVLLYKHWTLRHSPMNKNKVALRTLLKTRYLLSPFHYPQQHQQAQHYTTKTIYLL